MPVTVNLDLMLVRRKVKSNELARAIGITESNLSLLKSGKVKGVRFSTLDEQIFIHSAYPTDDADAVFFGPDTYRFAREVRRTIGALRRERLRILDMGAGSGAGALYAAHLAGSACAELGTAAD